jgi:poly-gamma-glutamate synthesis protein (capsule biosynthesis protein)
LVAVTLAALVVSSAGCGPSTKWTEPVAATNAGLSGAPSHAADQDITLAFAGDVHFTERTAALLRNDPRAAFGPIADTLARADVAMVNLETAVTDRGTAEPKQYHFRAPLTALDAVRGAGVDVVTIANNHTLDYGQVGLGDTLDAAKRAAVPAVGAGRSAAEAYAPWVTEVRGTRIAFLGFSQIHELEYTWAAKDDRPGVAMASDLARASAAVAAARKAADVVVVYVHWGQEGNDCPTSEQKTFAARMSAAGADLIVGTHAHLLLGEGWMGGSYVAYGLGNFVWWWDDAFSNDTGVLTVSLHAKKPVSSSFTPAIISTTSGQPIPATGAEAARVSGKLADLRGCTGLAGTPR